MITPTETREDAPSGHSLTIADWLNISHELRTPANAILGHVELLISGAMGPLPSEVRAGLGDIQRASHDLMVKIAKAIEIGQELSLLDSSSPEVETHLPEHKPAEQLRRDMNCV